MNQFYYNSNYAVCIFGSCICLFPGGLKLHQYQTQMASLKWKLRPSTSVNDALETSTASSSSLENVSALTGNTTFFKCLCVILHLRCRICIFFVVSKKLSSDTNQRRLIIPPFRIVAFKINIKREKHLFFFNETMFNCSNDFHRVYSSQLIVQTVYVRMYRTLYTVADPFNSFDLIASGAVSRLRRQSPMYARHSPILQRRPQHIDSGSSSDLARDLSEALHSISTLSIEHGNHSEVSLCDHHIGMD